jgi:hypothetical protein
VRRTQEWDKKRPRVESSGGPSGFVVCHSFSPSRRKKLERRLDYIGGLEAFERALSVIHLDDFLMGQRPPKDGKTRFKLDIDKLLQTDGGMGDVLAKLLDRAGEVGSRPNGATSALADMSGDYAHSRRMLTTLQIEPGQAWKPAHGPPSYQSGCKFNAKTLMERGFQPTQGSS